MTQQYFNNAEIILNEISADITLLVGSLLSFVVFLLWLNDIRQTLEGFVIKKFIDDVLLTIGDNNSLEVYKKM